jgi:hypothetical protein
MAPDGTRCFQNAEKQYVPRKIAFLFFVHLEDSDSQNVVSAPDCPRWPRYLQMLPDDSRCPQMTPWSYYLGKLFYQRGRSLLRATNTRIAPDRPGWLRMSHPRWHQLAPPPELDGARCFQMSLDGTRWRQMAPHRPENPGGLLPNSSK